MALQKELWNPTKLQSILWGAFMELKFGKKDMLEVLDETTEHLSDEFFIMDYENPTVDYTEKR